jgi:hypothetical protein
MTKNLFKKNTSYEIPDSINPRKSWKAILYICFTILIIGFAYDYYIYKIVSREPLYVEVPGEEMKIERLKVEKINNIISFFNGKIEKSKNLKKTNLIDPAL